MKGPLSKFPTTLSVYEGTLSLVDGNGALLEIEAEYLHMDATNILVAWATDCPAYSKDGRVTPYFDGRQSHGSTCDCNVWCELSIAKS
mgnify:FL=1